MEFYADYKKDIIENVMPIIKRWYQPYVKELQNKHDVKIKEWKVNYDMHHSDDIWRNGLINEIKNKLPGFKYLVDFKWSYNNNAHDNSNSRDSSNSHDSSNARDSNNTPDSSNTPDNVCENGVGDLVFGSDYGIYLVLETKLLNNNQGEIAEKQRIEGIISVKERARKFKELAKKKFNDHKVIGVSYTNDKKEPIQFVDINDEKIFNTIRKNELEQENHPLFMSLMAGGAVASAAVGVVGILSKLRK
ncbi:hypothetical protein RclHR1_02840009 [Rhizophagus clarus]|uniref:Uncharacterized protein n=1 Tax=Rhizophagus clarus TaxID=94130 RepID=A0A2Z6R7E6_9GLOM|nr:hypothetical protein RclHR1_02840009 [Rhizophagus clarus]GES95736.1 hypothetical protein GLOIN_2v1510252 [Rhizophagus clarus]